MTAESVIAAVLLTSAPQPVPENAEYATATDATGRIRMVVVPREADRTLHALVRVLEPSLVALAIDAEIVDPRESPTILRDLGAGPEMACDLASLQTRTEAMRTAPVLAEVERLPTIPVIHERMLANRRIRDHLAARLRIDLVHADEIGLALQETEAAYQVLDAMRDARSETYYTGVRRAALARLRDLVGAPAYYEGRFPPHLPLR